jgi:ribosomal protein S18 acetylase RimI-like enzyme
MNIRFEINPIPLPDSNLVLQLCEKAGISFPNWTSERMMRALKNSSVVVFAWKENELIGFARVITDFAWVAYLSQIAVHPRFQKQGIGTKLLFHVLEKIGDEVSLVAHSDDSATGFYEAKGFQLRTNVYRIKRKK